MPSANGLGRQAAGNQPCCSPGFSDALSEMPKGHGLPGSYSGWVFSADVRTPQTFSAPCADAAALNAQCRQTSVAMGRARTPRGIRVPAMPFRKRPIDAGSSAAPSETPKGRALPGSYSGWVFSADVRTPQTFSAPCADAAALNAQCRQTPVAMEQARTPRGIRVPAMPPLRCPIDAGSSAAPSETPKGRGLPGSRRRRSIRRRRQYRAYDKAAQHYDDF